MFTKEAGLPSNDWMSSKWRPAMGWMYMVVCIFDFILFPIAWSTGQALIHQTVTEWSPLTLQGAGLFHMAMGAVLGVSAVSAGATGRSAFPGISGDCAPANCFDRAAAHRCINRLMHRRPGQRTPPLRSSFRGGARKWDGYVQARARVRGRGPSRRRGSSGAP